MRQKQVIALLLAALMMLGVFAGCGKKETGVEMNIGGEKVNVENIATIGGIDVPAQLYRYFFMNIKYSYDYGDESFWEANPDTVEFVKLSALNYMQNYAATLALAKEYGIELTSEDEAAIEDGINSAIDSAGSYASFKEQLEYSYLTEELYRELLKVELLSSAVYKHLFNEGGEYYISDAQLKEYVKEDYILSRHILISNNNENKEALIKEVQGKLDDGEDFRTLEEQYSEDTGSTTSFPDGVCYTEGTMITDFYETALNTKVGEISTVDTTEYGYFFIKRLELTDEYIDNNIDTLYDEYYNSTYNTVVGAFMEDVQYEYSEYYESITIDSFS